MAVLQAEITVAAITERDGRFLFIEERSSGRVVLTQPAGHLEPDESLVEAVVRETLEESRYPFVPEAVGGIYIWRHPRSGATIVRVNFIGEVGEPLVHRDLDEGILRVLWLDANQVEAAQHRLRNPLVKRGLDDYLAGKRYPLDILQSVTEDWVPNRRTG